MLLTQRFGSFALRPFEWKSTLILYVSSQLKDPRGHYFTLSIRYVLKVSYVKFYWLTLNILKFLHKKGKSQNDGDIFWGDVKTFVAFKLQWHLPGDRRCRHWQWVHVSLYTVVIGISLEVHLWRLVCEEEAEFYLTGFKILCSARF